jgi:hypothetical protein
MFRQRRTDSEVRMAAGWGSAAGLNTSFAHLTAAKRTGADRHRFVDGDEATVQAMPQFSEMPQEWRSLEVRARWVSDPAPRDRAGSAAADPSQPVGGYRLG